MPHIEGKSLIGWGVVRENPWHFAGLFPTRDEAQVKADALCAGYVVRYGERQEESDSFLSGATGGGGGNDVAGSTAATAADDKAALLDAVAASIDERIDRARH